jgi:hypothetical protein
MGARGFYIACLGCGRELESTGLRSCFKQCEQRYVDRQDNARLIVEAGIEPTAKRKCEECGADVPRWRNGREVSKKVRFCSGKCRVKALRNGREGAQCPDHGFVTISDKKTPVLRASKRGAR